MNNLKLSITSFFEVLTSNKLTVALTIALIAVSVLLIISIVNVIKLNKDRYDD